jgi:hypothetical protein
VIMPVTTITSLLPPGTRMHVPGHDHGLQLQEERLKFMENVD